MRSCSELNCTERLIPRLYDGKSYCQEHYWQHLLGAFRSQYEQWQHGTMPPPKLISLAGRLVEEGHWKIESGLISGGRIRDRSYNHSKTLMGLTFEMTRHPGAWKNGVVEERVIETWEVNIQRGAISKTSERPWIDGDLDP